MPYSKGQKTLFCIALAMKKGKTPMSYSKQAAKIAETMSEEALQKHCESPVKKA